MVGYGLTKLISFTGIRGGMAAHIYMNQQPAHRTYAAHPHHIDPCLAAGSGHQQQQSYVTEQSSGAASYCMPRVTGVTPGPSYSNSGANLYPQAAVDSVKQLTPTMMVTHLNAQAMAVQYGR
jgi:hypothetical protein